jgi:nitrate/nitrite transporter NarK
VNIFIPFIGGTLIEVFGNKNMFLAFGIIIVIGQLIVYLGCKYDSIYTMLVGRVIFGLGGENLNVSQMACVVEWFYKSENSFPMGLTLTISRVGSFVNDVLSPRFAGETRDEDGYLNATNAFKWGLYFSIFSLINITIMVILDHYKSKELKNRIISLNNNNNEIEGVGINNDNSIITLVKKLNLIFWILSLLILTAYGSLMPFNYMAVGFFTTNYNISKNLAGTLMGTPFLMGAIFVPLLGAFVDKYGYRAEMVLCSGFFLLSSFILFNSMNPYIPLILLGFGYSIFACVLWPAISIAIVNKNIVGFAYGVATCLQNISMSINPMIIAEILVTYKSYSYCLVFLGIVSLITILLSGYLYYINKVYYKKILNLINYEDEVNDNGNMNIEIPNIGNSGNEGKNFHGLEEEI